MRHLPAIVMSLSVLGVWPSAGSAQETATPSDRTGIQDTISKQIEAFRRDDGTAALKYATPGLRVQFGDGPAFLEMVRTSYPAVFRPRSFAFTGLTKEDGHIQQKVEFSGPNGEAVLGLYDMQRDPDGWHIAGCKLVKSERLDM